MQRQAGALDRAGRKHHRAAGADTEKLPLPADIDLHRVHTTAPAVCSATTCARGTRNSRRAASEPPEPRTSRRIASTSNGRLLYLSKLNRPDTGDDGGERRAAVAGRLGPGAADVPAERVGGERSVLHGDLLGRRLQLRQRHGGNAPATGWAWSSELIRRTSCDTSLEFPHVAQVFRVYIGGS